jgi:hypothetical protein
VDLPQREHDLVPAKRAIPGESVLIIGVDERPVQIKECSNRHAKYPDDRP